MNCKSKSILFVGLMLLTQLSFAGEGMWLPQLLKALNEGEMHSLGMKMSAEDIYSVNKGSLKDAIVHFGGFCTSELISSNGLLLTNHHCGYSQIQSHTTLENNYLKDGFWAQTHAEELPNPGLFATFIVRIEDVSEAVLAGVEDGMDKRDRQSKIDQNIEQIKANTQKAAHEDLLIRPFYQGNQYFMFVTMTYNDVRLVGTPPESIGKFGADTDNWVWPRHTGDFSLFRIYAGKDNLPADYSTDNVPFQPKHFLPISLDGVAEGDFTLVFGFPGRTDQYLPTPAVEQLIEDLNPAKIAIRDQTLKILDAAMRADEQTRIQYASKFARIANAWKKWIGESQGLQSTNALLKKETLEAAFQKKLIDNKALNQKYGTILENFERLYDERRPYAITRDYYNEVTSRNVEGLLVMNLLDRLVNAYEQGGEPAYQQFKARLQPYLENLFKNYRLDLDQQVFAALMEMYANGEGVIDAARKPLRIWMFTRGIKSYEKMAIQLYGKSTLLDKALLMKTLNQDNPATAVQTIQNDELYRFAKDLKKAYNDNVANQYNHTQDQITELQRTYMKALMELFPEKRFFPDANSTMRVTYGQVNGYQPRDAVSYLPVTYLSGVMEKYKPGDYEFDVPNKLRALYDQKDYGVYADDGKMPICFLGSNHTTGGNSGSPAIDAHGNLIGLNFDRVWEGTMSDINYDKSICRNIMVDIRYVLFIVDKFAGAQHLIDEMKLVHPKKGALDQGKMKGEQKK
ncbi:MAG: S46 family peptidase [Bacteroidota bacterium]